METAGEGTVCATPGICLHCNRRFADMLCHQEDEILGKQSTGFSFVGVQAQIRKIRMTPNKGDVLHCELGFRRQEVPTEYDPDRGCSFLRLPVAE